MYEQKTGVFAMAEMRNDKTFPSAEGLAFMEDRTKYHLRNLEYRHLVSERMRPTREERYLKSRLRSRLIDRLDVRDDFERLQQLGRDRVDAGRFSLTLDEPGFVRDHTFSNPTGDGVMVFWARTSWFFPRHNFVTMWMDGDGLHLTAHFDSEDGDLHTHSIQVVAQYEIRPDRMPPKGRNYSSNPVFEVSGPVYGNTGPTSLWDLGDTWSKCWLNTKQTVFTVTSFDGIIRTAGSNSDSRQVIFLEDSGAVHEDLPGLMGLPVDFPIADADALIIELEWRLDIQIENGFIVLGHQPEAEVCTIRHPQWNIRER